MERVRELVEKELRRLRQLLEADVTAVAWRSREDGRWAWWAASGCDDDRYRNLAIRMGRGPEGAVPRIGRPLVMDGVNADTQGGQSESPFMRVERLLAAAVYPISGKTGVDGVLLAGSRSARTYSPDQLLILQLSSRWLSQLREYARSCSPAAPRTSHDIIDSVNGEGPSS